jgi:hypothetical protein
VSFHYNHNKGSSKRPCSTNGYVYVDIHLQLGPPGFIHETRLYLREKTVRKLNRNRDPEHHLYFYSKYALAHESLVELITFLPKDYPMYMLFDSWCALAKLMQFCRRHMIPHRRRIHLLTAREKCIDQYNLALKHTS